MPAAQDFLNRLQIASPCPASWAEMRGDERARFCATCEKHVYDFSKMTAAEGMALIREKEGQVCARLWRRADGTVITADCPIGAKRMSARGAVSLPKAAAAAIAAAIMNVACTPRSPQLDPVPRAAISDPLLNSLQEDGRAVAIVGALPAELPPIDVTTTSQGKTMSHEDWENLPLR